MCRQVLPACCTCDLWQEPNPLGLQPPCCLLKVSLQSVSILVRLLLMLVCSCLSGEDVLPSPPSDLHQAARCPCVQVSTVCVGASLVAAGGYQGELVVRNYRQEALAFRWSQHSHLMQQAAPLKASG